MKRSVTIKAAWIAAAAVIVAALIGLWGRSGSTTNVGGDYVAGDRTATTNVNGDYVARDKNITVNVIVSDPTLEARVRQVEARQRQELDKKYPEGSTVFGITGKGFIVPKGLIPPDMRVSWETAKVRFVSDTMMEITYPDVDYKGAHFSCNAVNIQKRIGAKADGIVFGPIRPGLEVVGIAGDLVVIALGFR